MGGTSSLEQAYQQNQQDDNDQMNQSFRSLILSFKVFQPDQVNNHYGKFQLLQSQPNINYFLSLKDILLTTKEEFDSHKQHWEMRCQQFIHTNVIQLHALFKLIDDHMCGSTFKISLLIDYIQSTLEDEMKTRPEQLKEEEIWNIIDSVVGGLAFLQSKGMRHGNISLSTIYVVNNANNNKLYKVADEQLMSYQGLYQQVLQNLMNPMQMQSQPNQIPPSPLKSLYLSPHLFRNLLNKDQNPIHNSFKSDVFSLGVNILHMALWSPMDELYDLKNIRIDEVFLLKQLNLLREKMYSNDLYCLLQEMLLIEENYRPDFMQLDQKLNLVQFLQGKRISNNIKPLQLLTVFPPPQRQMPMQMDPLFQQQQQQQQNLLQQQQTINPNQQMNRGAIFGNDITNTANNRTIFGDLNQNRNIFGQQQQGVGTMGVVDQNKSFLIMEQNKQNIFGVNNNDQQQQIFNQQQQPQQQDPLGLSRLNNPLNYSQLNQQQPQQNNPIFGQQNQNMVTASFNSMPNQASFANQQNLIQPPPPLMNAGNYNGFNQNVNFPNQQQQQQLMQQQQMMSPYNSFNQGPYTPPQFGQVPQPYGGGPGIYPNMAMTMPHNMYMGGGGGCQFCSHSHGMGMPIGNPYMMMGMGQPHPQMYGNNNPLQFSPVRGGSPNKQKERGKLTYEDGSVYEGDSYQGIREGYGKLIFPDGVYYEGMWLQNKMQGKGILYYANGEKAYEGDWFDNKFNNFGHLYNNQAKPLEGTFDYANFNKIQDYWLRYEGDFKMDMKDGFGTIYFTNGEQFSGTFVNDMIHGYGTFTTLDKNQISGIWDNNVYMKLN